MRVPTIVLFVSSLLLSVACDSPAGSSSIRVSYDANGSTAGTAPAASSHSEGATVTAAANSGGLEKTGCGFAGWNTAADGSGTTYFGGQTFPAGVGDLILYARWKDPAAALWASVPAAAPDSSVFNAAAADRDGNVYVAGYQCGTAAYDYGGGANATGTAGISNPVLVKYDPSGTALWARTMGGVDSSACFYGVAVDSSGNVYAAGVQTGAGTVDFGNGQTVTGAYAGTNALLVKYDASGKTLWARGPVSAGHTSFYYAVAADAEGNAYAAGYQYGTGVFDYGGGETPAGPAAYNNSLVVKYDGNGNAEWARTAVAAPASGGNCYFKGVCAEPSGGVCVVGIQYGNGAYGYGNGKTAAGAFDGDNAMAVKYDAAGTARWAASVSSGSGYSHFSSVASDGTGSVYAAGYQEEGPYGYGNGVWTAGGRIGGVNAVLVKYDGATGYALWAKSTVSAPGSSEFLAVSADGSGNVYAGGSVVGSGTAYVFGDGKTILTPCHSSRNAAMVKYDASGSVRWAKTISGGSAFTQFQGLAVDPSGNPVAAGFQHGSGAYDYGDGVTASAPDDDQCNAVVLKYAP